MCCARLVLFKNLWKVVGRGSDPPAPLDSERGWREVLLASVLHGAIPALVKRLSIVAPPSGRASEIGIWPDGTLDHPDKSPDHHKAKAARPYKPGNQHSRGPEPPTRLPPDGDTPLGRGIKGRSDRRTTNTGQVRGQASRESALDTCHLANGPAAVSPTGEGGGPRRRRLFLGAGAGPAAGGQPGSSSVMMTRPGRGGVCPRAVDDALTRGLRHVIGGRGTAVIRNMRRDDPQSGC